MPTCSEHNFVTSLITITRQFTRAMHCSLSRTRRKKRLFNRKALKNNSALLVVTHTHRLRTNSLNTFSSREGINSRCRRFDRSCCRSCCRRYDGPLAINRDHIMLSPLSSLQFRLVGGDIPCPQLPASLFLFN